MNHLQRSLLELVLNKVSKIPSFFHKVSSLAKENSKKKVWMESVFLNLKSSQNLINNLVIVSRRPPDYISPWIESIDSDQIEMYTKMYAQMTRMNGKRNNGRYGYKG